MRRRWPALLAVLLAAVASHGCETTGLEFGRYQADFYIDRQTPTCLYRQYYRLSGGIPVRIITLKRFDDDGRFWRGIVDKETADDIQGIGGSLSETTETIDAALSAGTNRRGRPAAEIPLSPKLYVLDYLDRIAVMAPEEEEVLLRWVDLDPGTRGLAQAAPRRPIYVIHRRVDPPQTPAPPQISVFDPRRMEVTRVMQLSGLADVSYTTKPFAVAPDESVFYVANRGEINENGQFRIESSVEIYDVGTGALLDNIPMPPGPGADSGQIDLLAVSPDGSMVWAARKTGRRMVVLDTRTRTVAATFQFNGGMRDLAFHPNGSEAYVLVGGSLRIFNTATLAELANVPLEGARDAVRVLISPDGVDGIIRDDLAGLVWHVDIESRTVIERVEENPGYLSVMAFTR